MHKNTKLQYIILVFVKESYNITGWQSFNDINVAWKFTEKGNLYQN